MESSAIPWHQTDLCTVLQQVLQNVSLLLVDVEVGQLHPSIARSRQASQKTGT